MSDQERYGYHEAKAIKYNPKAAQSVGWGGLIPEAAKAEHPGLSADYGSADFAKAVLAFQKSVDEYQDGKLGSGTWKRMLGHYDPIDDDESYFVHETRRISVDPSLKTIAFDEPRGKDIHSTGHFSKRKRPIDVIVLHWGGSNIESLCRAFSGTRTVSSHFGIDNDTVYQILDTKHVAWHAGWINKMSIGVDICQQPTEEWKNFFQKKGFDVEMMDNPTDRGRKRVLSLHPPTAEACKLLVQELCKAYDVPFRFPRGVDGFAEDGDVFHGVMDQKRIERGEFRGVIGHHHIKSGKWDIACWWKSIFGE